jgi:hypothetical protein
VHVGAAVRELLELDEPVDTRAADRLQIGLGVMFLGDDGERGKDREEQNDRGESSFHG